MTTRLVRQRYSGAAASGAFIPGSSARYERHSPARRHFALPALSRSAGPVGHNQAASQPRGREPRVCDDALAERLAFARA